MTNVKLRTCSTWDAGSSVVVGGWTSDSSLTSYLDVYQWPLFNCKLASSTADPSSSMPCAIHPYTASGRSILPPTGASDWVFSSAKLCSALDCPSCSMDWAYCSRSCSGFSASCRPSSPGYAHWTDRLRSVLVFFGLLLYFSIQDEGLRSFETEHSFVACWPVSYSSNDSYFDLGCSWLMVAPHSAYCWSYRSFTCSVAGPWSASCTSKIPVHYPMSYSLHCCFLVDLAYHSTQDWAVHCIHHDAYWAARARCCWTNPNYCLTLCHPVSGPDVIGSCKTFLLGCLGLSRAILQTSLNMDSMYLKFGWPTADSLPSTTDLVSSLNFSSDLLRWPDAHVRTVRLWLSWSLLEDSY